ncbi:OmpW/AlkL family protein [Trinickia dinghuensis]|uniref:OmpW family protein n=1 Tax=Trinickia dinghuensis TaxID=2291023 RepID=A0A3D8JYY4_9BURK|nr:OmpW family outer membrane protein [Trinickia dinghuensis]RDU98258.1 OmpW family protein [Trinickia dinghuensis]
MNKRIGTAACAALLGVLAGAAHAQQAGDNVVTLGWFHIMPQQSSTPMTTYVTPQPIDTPLRLPSSFTSSGTGLSTTNADTAGLIISHFFTDHIALTTVAGVPPTFQLKGRGAIVPPGPAGALGTENLDDPANEPIVKSVRQWSPAMMVQYYFNKASAKFRPFVGVGISYNFFTDIQLNPNFTTSTENNLGAVLAAGAAKPGPTSVSAKASPSWAPVFNAGASYNITKHWGVSASLTYIPLKTRSTVYVRAADGTLLGTTQAQLTADPLITYVAVSYTF